MEKYYIRGCGHITLRAMPQENFTLIDFNWDQSVNSLRHSRIIKGDFDNEIIAHNKGKLCLHIKVEGDNVSFHLSLNGKLQISSPNAELLRRAKSQLRKLIICSRWVPSGEENEPSNGKVDYQSIMDLPEAKEADWSRIPKAEILKLNQWFQAGKDYNYEWLLDLVRSTLKNYTKHSSLT
jgi:hypothetical protein